MWNFTYGYPLYEFHTAPGDDVNKILYLPHSQGHKCRQHALTAEKSFLSSSVRFHNFRMFVERLVGVGSGQRILRWADPASGGLSAAQAAVTKASGAPSTSTSSATASSSVANERPVAPVRITRRGRRATAESGALRSDLHERMITALATSGEVLVTGMMATNPVECEAQHALILAAVFSPETQFIVLFVSGLLSPCVWSVHACVQATPVVPYNPGSWPRLKRAPSSS
jgi:hypothetical protein